VKDAHNGNLVTYYLVAFFIPNKFPTLLAEREIIANALLVRISPRTEGKDIKIYLNQEQKGKKSVSLLEKCFDYSYLFCMKEEKEMSRLRKQYNICRHTHN
jgi:hypothetical protein